MMILKARAILLKDITADTDPNGSATESKNSTSPFSGHQTANTDAHESSGCRANCL